MCNYPPVVEGDDDVEVLKVLPVRLPLGVDGCSTLRNRVAPVCQLPQVLHLTQQGYQLQREIDNENIYTYMSTLLE